MKLLLDTTVLIDLLRDHKPAVAFLETMTVRPLTSVATVTELFAGMYDERERASIERTLSVCEVVPMDHAIAERAGLWRRRYGPSHNTGIIDAMIASTAMQSNARLVSHNRRHFPMLADVLVPY